MKLQVLAFSALMLFFFDLLISSNSILQMRLVFDFGFTLISLSVVYLSLNLIRKREFPQKERTINLPYKTLIPLITINLIVVASIWLLDVPSIGFLQENILTQGLIGFGYLGIFLLVAGSNSLFLCTFFEGKNELDFYKIPAYILGIVAIESSLSIYSFEVGGLDGIRFGLSAFHLGIVGLLVWKRHRFEITRIRVKTPDLMLTCLSIGILLMVVVPFALYSQFTDNSVIVGTILAITQRGSLQPYYDATKYYSPVGGFVSLVFSYLTGLGNILLSSSLAFMIAHLALPFVTYYFLKSFVTNDERIALIGSVMTTIMDGLGVILLPLFIGNLTPLNLNWAISPATMSLKYSTLRSLWFIPYKAFGWATVVASCALLRNRKLPTLLLSGALVALSFTSPRQAFQIILLLAFLFGLGRLRLREVLTVALSAMFFLGPVTMPLVYKIAKALLRNVVTMGFATEESLSPLLGVVNTLNTPVVSVISMILILVLLSVTSIFLHPTKINDDEKLENVGISRPAKDFRLYLGDKSWKLNYSKVETIILLVLTASSFVYIILYAFSLFPSDLLVLTQDVFLAPFNYAVIRYHALIPLIIMGFIRFKYKAKLLIVFAVLLVLTYFGLFLETTMQSPLVIVLLSLPMLASLFRSHHNIAKATMLVIILLGVFSSTFYAATIESVEADPVFTDLPDLLRITSQMNPGEQIFCPSSVTYYAKRIVQSMGNLEFSIDPSALIYILDLRYTDESTIKRLVDRDNMQFIYEGKVFALLEK